MKVSVTPLELAFREPMVASWGRLARRTVLVLRLEGLGAIGFGEAAPLPGYDGVRVEDVLDALADCRSVLEGWDGGSWEEVLEACWRVGVLPQAVAAVDLALWDLRSRLEGRAVWSLLGAATRVPVAVNAVVGAPDRAGAVAAAASAVASGYQCVKLKVGLGDDAGRVAAVRAVVGPDVALRLDANGAWEGEQAVAALRALAPAGIELCEEPVHGVEELRFVREAGTGVPIALDETARAPGALAAGAADLACLKIAGCGGITGLLRAAAEAREAGLEVYIASTYDGPPGIAAALHAATALGITRPCGLGTLGLFAGYEDHALVPRAGTLTAPAGPGLI